ncbi:MAG: VTC domain-containing protein [Longimicrobiales bacterium]
MRTASPPGAQNRVNRFELKYLVPCRQVPELVAAVAPYTTPDAHDLEGRGYPVFSVYWDSPGFLFFWEKVEGLKYRRKLRLRRYAGMPDVMVEVKQRIDRTLQKRRLRLPLCDALHRFAPDGLNGGPDSSEQDPLLSEVALLCYRHQLRPRMAVRYQRRALYGVFEPDLRITIDTRVQYSASELDVAQPFETGRYIVDPRVAILELKFTNRVPLWLVRTVERFGLSVTRLSKYCSAVDRAHFGRQYT